MQVKSDPRTGLAAEVRIIPRWVWALAVVGFLLSQVFFDVVVARLPNAPPAWARPLLGFLLGVVLGCFLLLLGYMNRDAKRRGMSPVLWTLVALLIPNCLGILLYFILRHPLQSKCPQCENGVRSGFNFCPRCSCKLSPNCPQCQRAVGTSDIYCSYCGISLAQAAPNPEPPNIQR